MTSNQEKSDMYICMECGDVVTVFSESMPVIIIHALTMYI